MKLDHCDRMLFASPMTEVARILAAGLLRLRQTETGNYASAANVSEKELDVSAEKSVHCGEPARQVKSRHIPSIGGT